MVGRRRRSARLAALVAALALALGGLPRSPLVEHEHAAGDRAHRHAGDEGSSLAAMLAAVAGHAHGHGAGHEHGHGAGHAHRAIPGHAGHGHDGHAHDGYGGHRPTHAHLPTPDGEERHVHAVAADAGRHEHDGGDRRSPSRDPQASGARREGIAIEPAPPSPMRHAHWASIFDLAARSALPVALRLESVRAAASAPTTSAERVFAGRQRARSPPPVVV
jgi:hypothetical protein